MELLEEVWTRAWAVQEPLPQVTVLLIGLVVLGLVLFGWRWVRMLVTVCHEGGHALAAVLSGRRLSGIRLHSDTSGLTLTRGRPRGPGMIATVFAGYPSASVLGLGAAAMVAAGYSAGLLWVSVVLLIVVLVNTRNLFGLALVLGLGAAGAAVTWLAEPQLLAWLGHGVAWLLLLGGPRPVLEAVQHGRRPSARLSDAAQLAQLTRLPRLVWLALWLAATVGALMIGGGWLLPGPFFTG